MAWTAPGDTRPAVEAQVTRHYHRYEKVGPAPDFAGKACLLWRCRCGREIELFDDVDPPERSWAK